MTIDYYSDAQLDAIAALDVHLDDDASIQAAEPDIDRVSQLEMDLAWTQQQRETAEAGQAAAEEARQAEADRADRERDRADGAEAHARALLAETVWRRAAELGYDPDDLTVEGMGSVVESLWDAMETGVRAGDLSPDAAIHGLLGAK